MTKSPCQLYIISPEKFALETLSKELDAALSTGKVGAFQLRMKSAPEAEIITAAKKLLPICHKYKTMFIINDSAEIALKTGADGVHVGEEKDGTYEDARKLLGKGKIIGVSCYGSTDRALEFAEKGADYVAFGAFYPTTTKTPKARPQPDIIEWWVRNCTTPCVAIGGITPENAAPLIAAGADFIAAVSAIWNNKSGARKAVEGFGL